jgi:predicted acyltransferase (DUF342 family)
VFIYLIELLKRGHSEEVDRILKDMEKDEMIAISEKYLFLPNGSALGTNGVIQGALHVGKKCKILGNYHVKGHTFVDKESKVIGTVRCSGNVVLEAKTSVEGTIEGDDILIKKMCTVAGDIKGRNIKVGKDVTIGGVLKATDGITFYDEKEKKMKKKVERFTEKVDVVDEVAELL